MTDDASRVKMSPMKKYYPYPEKRKAYRSRMIAERRCVWCGNFRECDQGRYCNICKQKITARTARIRRIQRQLVLNHYGAICACCGERNPGFLSIDHINSDGAEHYRRDSTATNLARWLVKHNFPEGFQLLCYNCNCGRHYNGGTCPHQTHPPVVNTTI